MKLPEWLELGPGLTKIFIISAILWILFIISFFTSEILQVIKIPNIVLNILVYSALAIGFAGMIYTAMKKPKIAWATYIIPQAILIIIFLIILFFMALGA